MLKKKLAQKSKSDNSMEDYEESQEYLEYLEGTKEDAGKVVELQSPLQIAIEGGNKEIIEFLKDKGAKEQVKDKKPWITDKFWKWFQNWKQPIINT